MAKRVAVLVGLLAASLLPPTLDAEAKGAPDVAIHVPEARAGDRAVYADPSNASASLAFEWLEPAATVDRWGIGHEAAVLRTLTPPPAPFIGREAAAGSFAEEQEAFAGVAHDPLWRVRYANTTEEANPTPLPWAAPQAWGSHDDNKTTRRYDAKPLARSCLAHHGAQERALAAGDLVPLAALCPAILGRVHAVPGAAEATTFLGRPAVALRYDVTGVDPGALDRDDLDLSAGQALRVVLADGLPFVAEAEATSETGELAWRVVLTRYQRGSGAPVAAWREDSPAGPAQRPGFLFEALGPDGPRDGGSGLRFTLEEAVAAVKGDPTLVQFQRWRQSHLEAVVVLAGFRVVLAPSALLESFEWDIFLGQGGQAVLETFRVASTMTSRAGAPVLPQADGVVSTRELGPMTFEFAGELPRGVPSLDVASALRIWRSEAPAPFNERPVTAIHYFGPVPGQPPTIGLLQSGGRFEGSTADFTSLTLDASTGALLMQTAKVSRFSFVDPELLTEPLAATSLAPEPRPAERGPPPPLTVEAFGAVLTVSVLVAVLAFLAHGGYLSVSYSRLRRTDLLENPARRRIHDLIRAQPGIHLRGLVDAMGVGEGATRHHLRILERASLVTNVALKGYRRYYLTGTVAHGALRGHAELQAGSARRVYEAVRSRPGITVGELARSLDVDEAFASRTVARLAEAAVLEKRLDGQRVRIVARDLRTQN